MVKTRIREAVVIFITLFLCISTFMGGDNLFTVHAEDNQEYTQITEEGKTESENEVMPVVRAPALRAVQNNVITSIEAVLQDGSGPVTNLGQWQIFRLLASFSLPDNTVHAGDTTTITLPEKLRFDTTAPFEIRSADGSVVANAIVDGPNKTLTLTYTDYPETHSGVNGTFFFYVKVDRTKVNQAEDISLDIDVEGNILNAGTVHFLGIPNPSSYYVSKSGTKVTVVNGRYAYFNITINTRGEDLEDVVITDKVMTPAITIDKSSLKIRKGRWEVVNGDWYLQESVEVTSNYTVEWDDDSAGFKVNLGDVGASEGYTIVYYVESPYNLVDGEVTLNNVKLKAKDKEEISVDARLTFLAAGGTAEGYVYGIEIEKVDGDGNGLANAQFDVVRVANDVTVGTITTDAMGKGSISGLLKDSYRLEEKVAPDGFKLLEGPVVVEISDYGPNKVATKRITNYPKEPETISIPVEKRWQGISINAIEVYLYANGVKTDKTLILSWENGYKGSFEGLDKYDSADGSEIQYHVEEKNYYGYTPEVSGNQDEGFIITNKSETTRVTVSKLWHGQIPPAQPILAAPRNRNNLTYRVTVNLYADGTNIAQVVLSDENNYTYTFEGLSKYNPFTGREIVYTADEVNVPDGFTKVVVENADGSITIKNISQETIEIPVIKNWVGPKLDSVTVYLVVDDVKTNNTLVLNANNNYQGSFTNLFKYDQVTGKEIKYGIEEEPITNYESKVEGDYQNGFVITNKNVETTTVRGKKTWDDGNDQDGKRPEVITVNLYNGNELVGSTTTSELFNWEYSFNNLPKHDDNGDEINYRVEEEIVPGYTPEYNDYDITNTYTPRKTSIRVTKIWDDANNKGGKRPQSVTIHLYADGVDTGKVLILNSSNQWTGAFEDLDVNKEGRQIIYTIAEDEIPPYITTITGDVETGFEVKNSYTPPTVPKTGVSDNMGLYTFSFVSSVLAALVLLVLKRKYIYS